MAASNDKLDKLATAIDGITNQGAVSATVQEGDTYTIPKGYHNGNGTVSGVGGGGSYNLQAKTVTPTKRQQNVAPDSGYYGLSGVTVNAIPEAYQDVSSVTAGANDVLTGKVFVTADGTVTAGEMVDNGTVQKALDPNTTEYTIPKGFHSGKGSVYVETSTRSVSPTKSEQEILPLEGTFLTGVTVSPIPEKYQDVSGVTAVAATVLKGSYFVNNAGELLEGTIPTKGAVSATINGLTTTSYTIPAGYHNGSGTVSLTNDIENALAAI
jgi:hypothetical protein